MAVSKIVINGDVKIDLTGDTVTAADLKKGVIAHDRAGETIEGTCTFDADTSDATATKAEILSGRTAYVAGTKVTGEMANYSGTESFSGIINNKDDSIAIPTGFHAGGSVKIADESKNVILPENIKGGVTILGVVGTYKPAEVNPQANKTVVASFVKQEVTPDTGYDYLSKVTVDPVPYVESPNPQGGITISVG